MLAIDLVGLVITICLVGLRYPHYVFCAAVIHDVARVIMILFLHGNLETVVAAGAFGSTVAQGIKTGFPSLLVVFSGPLANYIISATTGGVEYEKTRAIVSPLASVRHPFAVVNLRMGILALLVNLWHTIF